MVSDGVATVEPMTKPAVRLDTRDVDVVVNASEPDERRCRLTHMAVYKLVDLMVGLFFFPLISCWLLSLR